MAITFTQNEEYVARAWLNSFITAGQDRNDGNFAAFSVPNSDTYKNLICNVFDEVVNRKFDFLRLNLDDALEYFGAFRMKKPTERVVSTVRRGVAKISLYIAWLCQQQGIYWDDTKLTSYELDNILKDSIFAKTLYDNGLFIGHDTDTVVKRTRNAKSGATAGTSGPSYKASGAQSGNIPNLIGTPGNKVNLSGLVYCIDGDQVNTSTPTAYIVPIQFTGSGVSQVSKASAEDVKFGTAKAWTYCKVFFKTLADAQSFLDAIKANKPNILSKWSNPRVTKATADSNGYYEVSTQFGNVFIKAQKLNEEVFKINDDTEIINEEADITEDVEMTEGKKAQILAKLKEPAKNGLIGNVDAYAEAMHKCC